MEIPKPTDHDKDRFRSIVPDAPGVEVKPMFGNLGAFVNGNMFMGLFGPAIGLKLDEPDRETLLALDGTGPFGPAERPMGGYVSLPEAWDGSEVEPWAARSLAHVSSLPAKIARPKTAKSAGPKAAKSARPKPAKEK
ncbi:MAG: hypothetical protein QOH12_1654 [Solirubrobacteraceae bacterium]|nr:hypothetical protein [Solirubrobacteraceae bacterium]